MKREAELKRKVTAMLQRHRPHWITLLQSTAGAPDRVIVGDDTVSCWEFKHATPDFRSPGIQELMCLRLAEHSKCWYVIWAETAKGAGLRTMIVSPHKIHALPHRESGLKNAMKLVPEAECEGYDMTWLVERIIVRHLAKEKD